jgi:hypothetical protein
MGLGAMNKSGGRRLLAAPEERWARQQRSRVSAKLGRGELDDFVASAAVVIVRVENVARAVHQLLIDQMAGLCENGPRCGHIAIGDLPYRTWLQSRVVPEEKLLALLGGVALFLNGNLATFHSGRASIGSLAQAMSALSQSLSGSIDDENAMAVLSKFAPFVRCHEENARQRAARSKPVPTVEDPYAVLGVEPDASEADVEQAWRRIRKENSPDRLVGLSQKLQQVAHEASVAANVARDTIRSRRGWGE